MKVQAPKTQAAAKTTTPAKPAAAKASSPAAATASAAKVWAPAASKTSPNIVKLVSAEISSDGVKTMKQLAPKGYSLQIGEDKRTATQTCADGKPATFTWDSQTLSVKNDKTGK